MTIRQKLQEREDRMLSPLACRASAAQRKNPEPPCDLRTDFQRDRDRILHCNSFRRLKHKTQVFLSPEGDHYRTRLTHTLEVSQIGRTIARALCLNEDLTEAAAMGHDLGHTPFGHAGEDALAEVCSLGFVHAEQSVRVVEMLEGEGAGLNLTTQVVDAIARHSHGRPAETLEGRVVRFADKIAYMNHDIDDAVRAGILSEQDIPWKVRYGVGRTKSERITAFVRDIAQNSKDDIAMSPQMSELYTELRNFMFSAVYTNPLAKGEEGKAADLLKKLFEYFTKNTHELPELYKKIAEKEGCERASCDYVASMSDRFAMFTFDRLFVPKVWGI